MPAADTNRAQKRILLVSTNYGENMGGEAIKAYQYAKYLEAQGREFVVITHGRGRAELERSLPTESYRIIEDDWIMLALWNSKIFASWLNIYFHRCVRKLILAEGFDPATHVVHYIGPVSPVAVRLPPKGFEVVMGPFTGNIYYPPAFRSRMSLGNKLRETFHKVSQRVFGSLYGDKKNADAILVSGYERTRQSLHWAGCEDARLIDVVDAGVSEQLCALPRVTHQGENPAFMCSGRLVDHKGVDLAIKAVAKTQPPIRLSVFGDGVKRAELEALARDQGVADRVSFLGWQEYDDLIAAYGDHRGYVFPSLAEANGIVMQEAMMIGLPVITLRWGGPSRLADDDSALYVDPTSEEHITTEIASAMERLAADVAGAEAISVRARAIAEERFTWDAVAASWAQGYGRRVGNG